MPTDAHFVFNGDIMTGQITYTTASGSDIERIMDKIEDALEGEATSHIMISCLALALIYQYPNISVEQLEEGVRGASEWISMFISDIVTPAKKENMN